MTTTPKPEPDASPPVINADELYAWEEVRRRLRWRKHSARQAQRMGLKPVRFGSRLYIDGRSVLEWFRKLGEQQSHDSSQ